MGTNEVTKCGSEAAIHAMRSIFDADETDAVL